MGRVMKLLDVAQRLLTLEPLLIIYAVEPWTPDSAVTLVPVDEDGNFLNGEPDEGMTYFIEVFIAQDFFGDWIRNDQPPVQEICKNLIHYAIYDTV